LGRMVETFNQISSGGYGSRLGGLDDGC
jgi:hypothetical protein